ncbi:MAG: ABC transporter permease [Acholeplasmatales bacterium]|nr:ABC transporter permease [Acholeplasmatales bacterium]
MNKSLFVQSIKANWKIWLVVTLVMSLLVAQFCAMEEGVMNLTTEVFYGLMSVIIPTIYVVVTANNLLARQVDDGSMAYVLSSPIKRRDVAITQIIFLVSSIFITFLITFLTHILISAAVGSDSLSYAQILYLNVSSFVTVLAMGGICFMFSGIFNRSKYSIGAGGMLSVFFILMSMMAMFGGLAPAMSALANFKYFTIITLCDKASILDGSLVWLAEAAVLVGISAVTYTVGSLWFNKKNLPL